MLHIYTRHAADCGHADDTQWRRCRCPKWLRGVLPNGEAVRESAGTRSWEQAERNARKEQLAASVKLAWKKPTQSLQKKRASSSKKHARRQDSASVKKSA